MTAARFGGSRQQCPWRCNSFILRPLAALPGAALLDPMRRARYGQGVSQPPPLNRIARYEELPRSARRRLVRRALVRPTLSAAVLFVVYFTAPLDRSFSALTVVALIALLALFAGLIVFQTRVIIRSPYPGITAITALAFSIPLFVLLFSTVYYLMERSVPNAFTAPMTRIDALYFTVTVVSTVGFGDIAAHTEVARAIVTFQMVADLLLIGLVVRVMLNAVQTGKDRGLEASAANAAQPDPDSP